jgi:CrcB protein
MLIKILLIGAGGFLGVLGRYGAGIGLGKCMPADFPLNTMIINMVGSFLIGLVYELSLRPGMIHETLVSAIMVGVLGGFTTFSTFSLETVTLLEQGKILYGILNMACTVALCVVAVVLGKQAAKLF